MSTPNQSKIIRLGFALGATLVGAIIGFSLAPLAAAANGNARPPRLEVDLGMPMSAVQDAPIAKVARKAPASAPAPMKVAAPAPASRLAPASDAMTLKRVLVVDGPFRHGDWVWDEAGVPAGEVVITVDVKAQTIAVFRGGYQIGAAVVLYGADDYPTPIGTFPITQKDKDHHSNVYGNAPMPYMLRLTNDGVAIHASSVKWGNATHGCIGVPLAFAKLVFNQAKIGTKVIVTSGKMMAVPKGVQMSDAR